MPCPRDGGQGERSAGGADRRRTTSGSVQRGGFAGLRTPGDRGESCNPERLGEVVMRLPY